jgi:A/G-specific adenine glycosylase
MMEVPSTEWRVGAPGEAAARKAAPASTAWHAVPGKVRHGFTHFELEAVVWRARVRRSDVAGGQWVAAEALADQALPTVMRKLIAHALQIRSL